MPFSFAIFIGRHFSDAAAATMLPPFSAVCVADRRLPPADVFDAAAPPSSLSAFFHYCHYFSFPMPFFPRRHYSRRYFRLIRRFAFHSTPSPSMMRRFYYFR
jgi:hypothetical protein